MKAKNIIREVSYKGHIITVFEDGRLQIKFYDGTEFEVETE